MKFKYLRGKRIYYKTSHPLYGSENVFDSWMVLCEVTLELAQDEARRRTLAGSDEQLPILSELTNKISDEMIATAEEYEPEETD